MRDLSMNADVARGEGAQSGACCHRSGGGFFSAPQKRNTAAAYPSSTFCVKRDAAMALCSLANLAVAKAIQLLLRAVTGISQAGTHVVREAHFFARSVRCPYVATQPFEQSAFPVFR